MHGLHPIDAYGIEWLKVLRIYYCSGDLMRSGFNILEADRKDGMKFGVYRPKTQPTGTVNMGHKGKRNAATFAAGYKVPTKSVQVWPPVFAKKHNKPVVMPEAKIPAVLKSYLLDRGEWPNNPGTDTPWNLEDGPITDFIRKCEAHPEMTIKTWLTTPWHYNFLAKQPEKTFFHDGETFAPACRRCSRPFTDFEHL